MQAYFLRNLSEIAQKKALIMREEAQLWDILSRDLKREAGRREEEPQRKTKTIVLPQEPHSPLPAGDGTKMLLRIKDAVQLLGMSRSSIYKEISEGRLKVKRAGRRTFITMADIQAWCDNLEKPR